MERLCERPGCSEDAAVAYGMRIEDLVFWLDALTDANATDGGVLCQRHGDSMVVPRDWTLDDLRDPDLHLFRPPVRPDRPATVVRRRRSPNVDSDAQQLALAGFIESSHVEGSENGTEPSGTIDDPAVEPSISDANPQDLPIGDPSAGDLASGDLAADESASHEAASGSAWTPSFDTADDLDGLLAARGPLLSRAFRGTDRPA